MNEFIFYTLLGSIHHSEVHCFKLSIDPVHRQHFLPLLLEQADHNDFQVICMIMPLLYDVVDKLDDYGLIDSYYLS
ncbi:unnamed protein product [Rotaria socialis]|uniref:Uncharacterized protein n=2 Tax=Rotaria socialis TaxID=392032 RepID=A0A821U7D2_9BILA|nr:unnamed protein product [Rotaria socialis]